MPPKNTRSRGRGGCATAGRGLAPTGRGAAPSSLAEPTPHPATPTQSSFAGDSAGAPVTGVVPGGMPTEVAGTVQEAAPNPALAPTASTNVVQPSSPPLEVIVQPPPSASTRRSVQSARDNAVPIRAAHFGPNPLFNLL